MLRHSNRKGFGKNSATVLTEIPQMGQAGEYYQDEETGHHACSH